jgi:hypothetical protein
MHLLMQWKILLSCQMLGIARRSSLKHIKIFSYFLLQPVQCFVFLHVLTAVLFFSFFSFQDEAPELVNPLVKSFVKRHS